MSVGAVAAPGRLLGSRRVRLWLALLAVEALLLGAYLAVVEPGGVTVRYLLYPFVWIDAGLLAVAAASPMPGSTRHRALGLTIAGGYFLVVMAVPGNVGLGAAGAPVDLRIGWYAPGWGPLVAFGSPWLRLFLVPFEVVGYAALSYLVYANVLDLTRGVLPGVLGLATCGGCTVPVLAPVVGLLGGPAAGLTSTAYAWS